MRKIKDFPEKYHNLQGLSRHTLAVQEELKTCSDAKDTLENIG